MTDCKMNGFAGAVIQLLQVRQAYLSNIQLFPSGLTKRNTSHPKVIIAVFVLGKEPSRLQIDQKAVNGAHRQAGEFGDLRRGDPAPGLADKLQHTQAALQ